MDKSNDSNDQKKKVGFGKESALFAIGIFLILLSLPYFGDFIDHIDVGNLSLTLSEIFWFSLFAVPGIFLVTKNWSATRAQYREFVKNSAIERAKQREQIYVPAGAKALRDIRQSSDLIYTNIENDIDKAVIAMEQVAATGNNMSKAVGGLGALAFVGKNWIVCALTIEGDQLVRWRGMNKTNQRTAAQNAASGLVALKEAWRVPLLDVPTNIEVGSAGGHMANVSGDAAARVEEVFFIYRGRRMVLGSYFDQVHETATIHQFEVREFIMNGQSRLGGPQGRPNQPIVLAGE